MPKWNTAVLRDVLAKKLSPDDLRNAADDVGPGYDTLPGDGQIAKTRELILYLDRRTQLDLLVAWVKERRPDIDTQQFASGVAGPGIVPTPTPSPQKVIKILFLAANPTDTPPLGLDEEIRSIDQALRQAEYRDKFELVQKWAVRVTELQSHLERYQPDIVHFSGHGSSSGEIVLEDNSGTSRAVSNRALSQLFALLKDNIRCVVLNACFSEPQAQAIAQSIDCVIGMSKAIGDVSAIRFAAAFYQALGFGRDVNTAFELGKLEIDLENLGEQDTPKLLATKSNPKDVVFVRGS
jgi:hypothetical protein